MSDLYSPAYMYYYLPLIAINVLYYLVSFSLLITLLLLIKGKNIIFIDVFSQFSKCAKLRFLLIVTMFNIAGTPPTPLFLVKSANLYFIYDKSYSVLFILLLIVNLISITFYVQLVRFIYGSRNKLSILISNKIPFISKKNITIAISLLILSLFLVISPYEFLLPLTFVSSY